MPFAIPKLLEPLHWPGFRKSYRRAARIETIMTLYWINLWLAIAMSLAGQTLLKAGAMTRQASTELLAQFLDPRTVAGLTLYVAAAFLYIIALRRIPLSVALPCTAASYIGAIFIGHFLYNETITLIHLTAVAFIGCGVILLAFAAK
jgi:multidrug transporter EmrE-like cation transporter